MADIFISYSRDDRPRVEPLAEALVSAGYSVWWDRNLAGGSRYLNETEAELKAAKAVLVVWTKTSVASHWVADEAGAGRDTGRLLPISLDGTAPPLGFRQFQVIDFSHWKPGNEAQLTELRSALGRLIGSSGAMPPSAGPIARKPIPRRTLMIGGLAAAGVALIAAVAMFAMGPQASSPSAAPTSQGIAFFGFTTTSDDPAARAMAEAATDQMFQTMGLNKLDSAARDETLGTLADKRLARAAELGSLYALSGEVRADKEGMTLSIRFVDVPSRMTLWENSVSGPASEADPLPARAAWPASQVMRCFVRFRSFMTRDTRQLLKLIADRCREGNSINNSNALQVVSRERALAQADPSSAYFQAILAFTLVSSVQTAPASARPSLIAEAEALLARATELDPQLPFLILVRVNIAGASAVPLGEYDRLVLDALAQTEGKDAIVFSQINQRYTRLLAMAGRLSEALPYASAVGANDPGRSLTEKQMIYAVLGQSSRARAEYEMEFSLNPTAGTWSEWTFGAIFLGAGDAEAMLQAPPSFVSNSVVACFSDIRKAYVSKDAKARSLGARRASECGDAGDLTPFQVLASLASLGDLDEAFALAGRQPQVTAYESMSGGAVLRALFLPTSRAMRADPRFLPLVEKLGLMEYWRATKTQPDVCETEDVPFCRELKASAQAGQ